MASKGEELWKKYKSGGDSDITPSSSASTTSTKNNAVERWNKWKQDNSTLGSRVQESGSDLFDRYNHVIERASGLNQFYKNWRGTSDREKYRASYGDMEALKGELSSLLETDLTFLDRGQVQEMLDNVSIISDALSQYEEYYSQGETAEEFQYALEQKLPWYQRSDRLRDARGKVSSASGKSYYQTLMERIMQRDRELSAKWGSTHQQIGSTYLTGSGGYNAPLNEHYNNVGQAYLEDRKDLDELLEEKHWLDYVQKYTGKEFSDDFWGTAKANYTIGRLSQDSSMAWNHYLDDPTEENRRDAETIDQLITEIQWNNEDVFSESGDESIAESWLARSLANYIPQYIDQIKYGGSFGAAGALTGTSQGVKAGMVLGSGAYSYMTMRGAAFKSLLEAGVPEEQAREAAKDEAVVSTMIEMADTAIDLATLGGGKLIDLMAAGSIDAIKKQIAKGVGKNAFTKLGAALANYGINIGSEWLEEATQESVSIANQNNPGGGVPGLIQDAAGVFFKSVLDSDSEEGQQIREAGAEGAKIAAMLGGIQGIGNQISYTAAQNYKGNKIYGQDPQALAQEALEINPESRRAQKVQKKLDSGKKVSGLTLSKLAAENDADIDSQDRSTIQSGVKDRLTELGETGDVDTVSQAILQTVLGEPLSNKEQKALDSSTFGKRVINEVMPYNVESGDFSSEWAKNLGTYRLYPEIYGDRSVSEQITQDHEPAAEPLTEDAQEDISQEESPAPVQKEAPALEESTEAEPEAPTVAIQEVSQKYGKQSGAVEQIYRIGGGDQDVAQFDRAYEVAYNMGQSGVNLDYAMKSQATSYLTEEQRKLAYQAGQYTAQTTAKEQMQKNTAAANGKTGRKKGVVKSEGVQISDLTKNFNDPQKKAYRTLSTIAEVTGIDIVLYKSQQNQDGRFEGAQGRFKWDDNAIYIDVNAGLSSAKDVGELSKYTMLRTFNHEFTHFIEKWNPEQYNELRETVFDTLTEQGMNVEDLIDLKLAQDTAGKLTYDLASREVVAEAMTDILPDSSFVETLAQNHRTLFETLLSKLKEFIADVKSYFASLAQNPSREARALQKQMGETVSYLENIVKVFDQAAVRAVEQYQSTVAEDVREDIQQEETTQKKSDEQPKAAERVEPKQETKQEPEAPAAHEVPSQEYRDENGFTVQTNSQYGTLEISFDSKPDAAIRSVLKANKFRWNGKKGVWYGKADQQTIVDALRSAYAELEKAPAEAQTTAEPAVMEESAPEVVPQPETQEAASDFGTQKTPSESVAENLLNDYLRKGKKITANNLYEICEKAFGGTQAQGAYNRKDAYDAMELAVNRFIIETMGKYNGNRSVDAKAGLQKMLDVLGLLPTQSVRTEEQQQFQQFSTPPNIAYLAAWSANVNPSDVVLEPSAGIGGLAAFPKAWGAEVVVNELSQRRLGVLRSIGFDKVFNENAEQIDNVLPDNIRPSLVIMNPPFSSTAGRTTTNRTSNAERHINQALERLEDGGRLVAILGKGMSDSAYSRYWNQIRKEYNIRANLSIDGDNYKKYGTTWGVQLVVIDKTGPQTGETVTGEFQGLMDVPDVLEGIRNDRTEVEGFGVAGSDNRIRQPVSDGKTGQSGAGYDGGSQRTSGSTAGNASGKNREGTVSVSDGNRDSSETGIPKTERKTGESKQRGTSGTAGLADPGSGNGVSEPVGPSGSESKLSVSDVTHAEETVSDDGVYTTFVSPDIPLKGGKKHPAVLVESAAMAAVPMPKATYRPSLPDNVVRNNLSDAQLVSITYAGQSHEQKLPNGSRKGFFIGDGTGVGKGRQIAGIILDNFMQGRKKAVWISKNNDLFNDAIRDWTATTGRDKSEVISQSKIKAKDKIQMQEGILFSTYDTLKTQKGGNRLDQIVDWVGKDFDGVIAFDEAHNMGNLFGKKGKLGKSAGSEKARAGVELQRRLPNARIVYVSATGATEVDNLAYAERLGLWGQGTAFQDAKDFISKIGSSGLAAMELVVRDLKAMGVYVARSISYNGVNYDTVEHTLNPMQTEIYNTMSKAWQKTMQNVQSALETTGGKNNSIARQRAMGNYYSAMQRFYNQVLTSMSMPSVIADMKKELAAGNSCVLQVVNTNEAQQNKQLAAVKAEGGSLDDLDLTPRESLIGYLRNSFPVQMFEEYTDEDGNLRSRPVINAKGEPVLDRKAVRQRDALIAEINEMSIPDGPLEMLFDAFGTENVAENTGRSRRIVPKKMQGGSIKRVEESRTLNHRTADVQAFQDGKKRILVFSDAGGTGKSYHADRNEKNQQQRIHYVLQPGWVASNAVQGFGRTHRSNEVSAPVYKLITTNIKGQKRFTSTIARRLDQLGALTKGQRDTGSGMFGAMDNLETDLAKDSLREFYIRLGKNQIAGMNGMQILDRLGLKQKFTDEFGRFKVNDAIARDIGTFLNRILALEVDEQNIVFDGFLNIYETALEAAIQAGTLDTGMENVKADKIEILDDDIIRTDKNSGASTHYVQAKTYRKPKIATTVDEMANRRTGFIGLYKTDTDSVKAVYRIADKTTEWGEVRKQYRLAGPNLGVSTNVWGEDSLNKRATEIPKEQWQQEWEKEIAKVPEYNEETLHMLTGALLPIWNSLPQEGSTKVKRLISSDGNVYLGRVIDNDSIDGVLRRFDVSRTREAFTSKQVMDKALKDGTRFQLTDNRAEIFRSRVSGEWRLELKQQNSWYLRRTYPDLIQERIQYVDRYFIPTGEKGIAILDKILADNPVRATSVDQEQAREVTFSDREILEIAANDIRLDELTPGERDALQIFRDRLTRLNELQEKRTDLGSLYREQQFGANGQTVDRAEAAKTLERMKILDSQIEKARSSVLDVENKEVLRKVLHKARKVVEEKQRDKDAVTLKRWRDRRNQADAIRKYRKRIEKDVKSMTDWVINPGNKDILKHVPDALKNTVIPFLTSIDFTSKRQLRGGKATQADAAFVKRLDLLKNAMRGRMNDEYTGMYSGYTDLPPDFMDRLESFIDKTKDLVGEDSEEYVINRMTAAELKSLSDIVANLRKLVKDFNRFHANAMYQHVYEAADATIQELKAYRDAPSRTRTGESVNNFLFWEQIRPAYAFERFGKGGMAIYDGLRRGQAQLAFDTREIVDFSEKAYTDQEVKAWDKEVKEVKVGGLSIRMKVSQIMSLYELSKRKQAYTHIIGNGIRVSTFFDDGKKVSDTGHKLTPEQVSRITDVLTPRQKEVADQLQQFMQNKGGQWGNYVSMKRFGENQFGEPNYFPINSDGRHLEATADENPSAASLYALLNMGFTKQTVEKAKNRIVIYSIFDVFANHMASMAQYHSMALPVLDALKWFNYNQEGSVREELNRVFGAPEESRPGSGKRGYAENFIIGILKAFNGTEAQGVPSDTRGLNALRRFNMAQVAYNARVVVQQPLAITRAALLLDYSSIVRGMKLSPDAIRQNIQEMNQHSGIAAWKGLGFYDTNISRGLSRIIKHDETLMSKIGEIGMTGAEKADEITWSAIWSACKEEVRKKHPDLKPGTDRYFDAVTQLFEDVVYKTQVVDSVLTKNEYLRSKGPIARITGSFMSEPTTTASMVMDAFDKYRMDLQKGMSKEEAWQRNKKNIVRTVYVYAVGAVSLAAVQAIADAFRDDDDYANFLEKWLDAFAGNLTDELMPFNKLPILSDFYELAKELAGILGMDTYGNPPQSVYMQWYDSLVKGVNILYQKISGEDTNYTWYAGAYKLLQAASGIVGLPMATATREIVTAWNSTVGTFSPRLKVKTYDSGEMNNIKYAYLDGYLTEEEATQELLSNTLVDNENEAYWKIREWDADGEYSRYDPLYQAARNGQSIQPAMEEFTAHGYTEKEVLSKLKSQIGAWYEGGEISKQQAVDMLEKYMDMDSQSIESTVNKWSSKVVTGIAFEDIKEEFLSGNLTASRAAEMYVRYGGYTKEDAQDTVRGWQFEQEWGFTYSQRKSAYKSGQITDSELRSILMDMGGKTAEEAEQDIAVYDWEMEVPGSEGISYAAIRDYYESVEPYGVSKGTYTKAWRIKNSAKGVDADGDGKKDAYSVVKEVMPQIGELPISNEQKDALAHCWWADSTVRKYKTW